jgi:mannose-6-phosphate isomerase class I
MVAASHFMVDLYELKDEQIFDTRDESGRTSVEILVAIEGCGIVEASGCEAVTLAKGDAVVVPASVGKFQVRPQWSVQLLKSGVPGETLPEPLTRI